MSQPRETFTHRQNRNYYFDEKKKIWYHEDGDAVRSLYLESLPDTLTREEISYDFSCFGEVEDVRTTKHSYGFITFTQPESATKALSAEFHTIGGHKTRVAIAKTNLSKKLLKQKLTEGNAKTFLSLNDDCLREIFSLLDTMDLCSLAVTCSRLKNIAEQIFSKNGKIPMKRWDDSKLILVTFGSIISKLQIGGQYGNKKNIRLLNLATRCCSDTLETLMLDDIVSPTSLTVKLKPLLKKIKTLHLEYSTIDGADKELFASCESLIELKVNKMNSEEAFIIENTYPKLQRLIFYPDLRIRHRINQGENKQYGVIFLIFGFLTLIGSMIYCVVVCRDAKTPAQLRNKDLYWTRHWQKNIGYTPHEINYKTDRYDGYSDRYSVGKQSGKFSDRESNRY